MESQNGIVRAFVSTRNVIGYFILGSLAIGAGLAALYVCLMAIGWFINLRSIKHAYATYSPGVALCVGIVWFFYLRKVMRS